MRRGKEPLKHNFANISNLFALTWRYIPDDGYHRSKFSKTSVVSEDTTIRASLNTHLKHNTHMMCNTFVIKVKIQLVMLANFQHA